MQIKFKKILPEAVVPKKGTEHSAGYDLTAVSVTYLPSGHIKYGTGIAVEIPKGYVGLLFPRSSVYKTGTMLANSVGVIDADYRGEISVIFNHCSERSYQVGDRVAQLIIMPYPSITYIEVDELSTTERGNGSYGSTGK